MGAHVPRGLDEVVRDPLERGVDGQDHEGQPDVREDDPHRPVRERDVRVRQAEAVQRPVEGAVLGQDRRPGVDPDEVARPEREEDQHEHEGARPPARDPRHVVRQREGQDRVRDGHGGGDPDRASRDPPVRRVARREELPEVVQRPLVQELAAEGVDRPERRDEEDDERRDVDADEDQHRRAEEPDGPQPRPAPEDGGDAEAGPPPRGARPCDVNGHAAPPALAPRALARQLRPRLVPGVVVHAVLPAAPAAVLDRGLPELDRPGVRGRCVQVVLRARALLDLVHEGARLRVDGRLAEDERLLGLGLRGRHVLHPEVRAVRVRRALREHPRVGPARRPLPGDDLLHGHLGRLELERLVRPRGADRHVAALEALDLVGRVVPVALQERLLPLQQRDGGVELRLRELVRVPDSEPTPGLHQVEGRVRDLDLVVRHGDLAPVLRGVDRAPALRRRLHLLRVVDERVRPPLEGDAVVDALDRVVGRALERRQEVLPARDQLHVHRHHVAAEDEPQARVSGGRDEVVLAAAPAAARAHERDHLVGRRGVLALDLAAGLALERLREARVRIGRPLDQVQRALALPDLRRQLGAAADACRRHAECRGQGRGDHVGPTNPPHAAPPWG